MKGGKMNDQETRTSHPASQKKDTEAGPMTSEPGSTKATKKDKAILRNNQANTEEVTRSTSSQQNGP